MGSTKFAPFRQGQVAFTEEGSGKAMILLHGFLENKSMWDVFLKTVSLSHRIICIDLPGHGQTDCFGYVHSMELMAEAVRSVMNHLKVRRAGFVGHSMGGYVALAFADLYPDQVRGISLFFSSSRADSVEKKHSRDRAIEAVKHNAGRFVRLSIPALFRPVNRKKMRDEVNAVKVEALKTSEQGIVAALQGMKERADREILLQFAPYPVHFICGDKDPVLPVDSIVDQTKGKESVSIKIIKGCGHMGHIEDPEWCLEEIEYALNLFSRS